MTDAAPTTDPGIDGNLLSDAETSALSDEIAQAAAASLPTPGRTSRSKTASAVRFDPALGFFVDKDGTPLLPRGTSKLNPTTKRHDFELDTRSVFDKDKAILGPVVHRDEDGFLIDNAGKKSLGLNPRKTYRRGTFWKVVGENMRVEAMCDYGVGPNGHKIWSGWARYTPPGTILECIGWRRFGKEGVVAPQFIYSELPHESKWSSVWPKDGVWRPWPMQGMLVQVNEDGSALSV